MSALLPRFAAAGIKLEVIEGGKLRVHGPLNDELRATIRQRKPAILAELDAANEAGDPDIERRRARVLELLQQNPNWGRVVLTESCGDQIIVTIGIRGLAV